MGSRYPPGSRLLVLATSALPRCGEVWAFVDDAGRVVAHRCVWTRRPTSIHFRGDAKLRLDERVTVANLVGRVTVVDDGQRQWEPRRRHAVGPTIRAMGSLPAKLLHRFRRRADTT